MTAKKIKPQKEGESLEERVNGDDEDLIQAAEDIIESATEEETDAGDTAEMDSEEVQEELVEPEPETAPVGPADYEDSSYIAPQVLTKSREFLAKYGINITDLTPKEVMDKIKKIQVAKSEAAQVLSRGQAIDGIERLMAYVPEGFVGEFKRENDMDIARAEAMDFKVFFDEKANTESSTGTGDGRIRWGDCVLMIIPEEKYIARRLLKAERLAERRKLHDPNSGPIDQAEADPLFQLIKL